MMQLAYIVIYINICPAKNVIKIKIHGKQMPFPFNKET